MDFNFKIFKTLFPEHVYRYIDQTGTENRPHSIKSIKYNKKLNEQGYDTYFTVNGFGNFKDQYDECTEQNITSITSFFIDIDGRKDLQEIEKIKNILSPTLIIETGKGYHLYWCLDQIIYKDETSSNDEWEEIKSKWKKIEQTIVTKLSLFGADHAVKDLARILRFPSSLYWKETGMAYTNTSQTPEQNAKFRTISIEYNQPATYTFEQIIEGFGIESDIIEMEKELNPVQHNEQGEWASVTKAENNDFYNRLNKRYPIDERPSFLTLMSGTPESIKPGESRNRALLVAASAAKIAGWDINKTKDTIFTTTSGWHGMLKETGGKREIETTINSAYKNGYMMMNDPILKRLTTDEEESKIKTAISGVIKERKDVDKVRFDCYEQELLAKYPHMKMSKEGSIFNYKDGVYHLLTKEDIIHMIYRDMSEDNLFGYRSNSFVATKATALRSVLPLFIEGIDDGSIINMKNGLLEVETLTLQPHTPDFISLSQVPINYDPTATAPLWGKCVEQWMEGDESEEKTRILKQYAGYCMTSSTKYQAALFMIGDGGNGKSTYADTIGMVVGKQSVSHYTLKHLHGDFGLAGLIGKKLNIVEEVADKMITESNVLKSLFSGEPQEANIKFQPSFKFKPACKFIFSVNQMPRIDDSSSGMERRILSVTFENNFRDKPDAELREVEGKLAKELPGIFNWAMEGLKDLEKEKKFSKTNEHERVIESFREDNSSVYQFILDCTTLKHGNQLDTDDLFETYKEYCFKDKLQAKRKKGFTDELKALSKKINVFTWVKRENSRRSSKIEGVELNDYIAPSNTFKDYKPKPNF